MFLLVLSGQGSLWCASTVRCPIAAGENLRFVAAPGSSPKATLGACSQLLCANFAKKNGVACGSLRHTAPHGVTYLSIESARTSRRLYGVYRNQTRDRGPAARRGFAQHERAVLLAVGVVVERGGGRPRRCVFGRPERVGAPVRRHDGDARLAHREGPVGAVVEQARAAVRAADVVRADVEPAVHGVADGAEAQAPVGTRRTLGRLRAALGGAHVLRCWGSPAAVCASLDNSGATSC